MDADRRRITELERALAAAEARVAELLQESALLDEATGGPDPLLTVDGSGIVVHVADPWPWFETRAPKVGEHLSELFSDDAATSVRDLASRGWVGAEERLLSTRDGRPVSLSCGGLGQGRYLLALRDETTRTILGDETERRKRRQALAELAGSLARELTDPMSIVQGRLELLLDLGVSDPAVVRRHLDVALDHARRVTASVRNFRLVGRPSAARIDPVRVDVVLRESLDLVGPRRERVSCRIEPPNLLCGGDEPILCRVVASLLRLSLESCGRGVVHARARRSRARVSLRIGPAGRSVAPALDLPDEVALNRALLSSLGCEFDARRGPTGLHFEVQLPVSPSRRTRPKPVRSMVAVVGSTLLCDTVRGLLGNDGYGFAVSTTGDAFLSTLETTPPDAVIADLLLDGGMSGLTLAQVALGRAPTLRGRFLLVAQAPSRRLPGSVVPVAWPLDRAEILTALGD